MDQESRLIINLDDLKEQLVFLRDIYILENLLGKLIKLLTSLAFIALVVFSLSQPDFAEKLSSYEFHWEIFAAATLISLFTYGHYLTRDKNRDQIGLDHQELPSFKELLHDDKHPQEIEDYLSREAAILLAEEMAQGERNLIWRILKRLIAHHKGKEVFKQLGLTEAELENLLQSYANSQPNKSLEALKEIILYAYNYGLQAQDDYIDLEDLTLGILEQPGLRKILKGFAVDSELIKSVVDWQKSQKMKSYVLKKAHEKAMFRPKQAVNVAMTSVLGETLENFTEDLTLRAQLKVKKNDQNDLVLSYRHELLDKALKLLAQPSGLVLLRGKIGVGKSTAIETVAYRLIAEFVSDNLVDKRLLKLNLNKLTGQAKDSAQVAQLLQKIFKQQKQTGNVIMVIDDLHFLLQLREQVGLEIINILANALQHEEVKVIATIDELSYKKYSQAAPQLVSMFAELHLEEASLEQTTFVIRQESQRNDLQIGARAIWALVRYSQQLPIEKYNPDKSLDLLKELAVAHKGSKAIDQQEVQAFMAQKLGVKPRQLQTGIAAPSRSQGSELARLMENIDNELVGQDRALKEVTSAITRANAGLNDSGKPLASFLFYGPTGVGKTFLAQLLAKHYFANPKLFLRLDMSEYQEEHNLDRLIGKLDDQGSYIPGVLTEFVKVHPYSLILLDELEKATPQILDLFLQVLDNASLKDARGDEVDFSNCIIIATSNIGTKEITAMHDSHAELREMREAGKKALQKHYRLEFLNRFDEIVMFAPLTQVEAAEIARKLLFAQKRELAEKGIEFVFTDDLVQSIVETGFDSTYGARSLKRTIQDEVEDKVAEAITKGQLKAGDIFSLG